MNGRAVFVPVAGGWAENVIHLSDQIKGLTVGANDRFAAIEARLDAHDNLFVEVTGWLKAQQEINRLSQLKVHTPTPEPSLEVEPHEVEPRRVETMQAEREPLVWDFGRSANGAPRWFTLCDDDFQYRISFRPQDGAFLAMKFDMNDHCLVELATLESLADAKAECERWRS